MQHTIQTESCEPGQIYIVNYTAKSIAVFGDTKPYREKLAALGALYNPGLKLGPGWILPKTRSELASSHFGLKIYELEEIENQLKGSKAAASASSEREATQTVTTMDGICDYCFSTAHTTNDHRRIHPRGDSSDDDEPSNEEEELEARRAANISRFNAMTPAERKKFMEILLG